MCFSSVWKWINWQIKLYSQEWLFCPTQASDFCWVSFHSSVNCHQSEGFAPRPFSPVCFLLGLFLFPASLFLENAYIHALSTMIGSYVCVSWQLKLSPQPQTLDSAVLLQRWRTPRVIPLLCPVAFSGQIDDNDLKPGLCDEDMTEGQTLPCQRFDWHQVKRSDVCKTPSWK